MFKLMRRAWKYLVAALTGKLDELADPKVQIEQAIEESKRRHELLTQQAAAVLGNRRELEIKLLRQIEEVQKLQGSARQALVLADQSRKAGDQPKADSYEETAQAFATKLVTNEATMRDLKELHDRAVDSAEMAKRAVEQNALALQKTMSERARLLSQLEQTKMQERMTAALRSMSEIAPAGDVPSLAEVRDKIDARYAKALGQAELAEGTVEARMVEVEKAALDAQATERLQVMRETLALEGGSEES
jgi:phage shock protein A